MISIPTLLCALPLAMPLPVGAGQTLDAGPLSTLNVAPSDETSNAKLRPSPVSAPIKSHIVSKFEGFDHGNVYALANGQVWKQSEYWIWIWHWISPKVVIFNDGGQYRMKVEGIDHAVGVTRIK